MSLTEVLPVEPVIPTTGQPSSRRQARASAWSAASGSSARQHPAAAVAALARARGATPARRPRPRRRPRAPPRRTRPRRRARRGRPKNRSPGPTSRESITARSGRPAAPVGGRPRRRAGGRDPLGRELDQALGPAAEPPRSSSRATSRSSKGILRPPSNSWPCSWPLPAITTVSPGCRLGERERDRRPPVGLDLGRRRRLAGRSRRGSRR